MSWHDYWTSISCYRLISFRTHFLFLLLIMWILSDACGSKLYFENSATTLTSWHLLVTFCSLHVALWVKLFEHKGFDQKAVMGFGILNGTSIGLLNLSLGFNSVGFYQVSSLLSFNFPHYSFTSPLALAFVKAWYISTETCIETWILFNFKRGWYPFPSFSPLLEVY